MQLPLCTQWYLSNLTIKKFIFFEVFDDFYKFLYRSLLEEFYERIFVVALLTPERGKHGCDCWILNPAAAVCLNIFNVVFVLFDVINILVPFNLIYFI